MLEHGMMHYHVVPFRVLKIWLYLSLISIFLPICNMLPCKEFITLNRCRMMSGPGVCVCNSSHNSITWRAESRTHLSKQTRPSTEHSRKASYVRGIPSRPDDQLRWVLIARSQV